MSFSIHPKEVIYQLHCRFRCFIWLGLVHWPKQAFGLVFVLYCIKLYLMSAVKSAANGKFSVHTLIQYDNEIGCGAILPSLQQVTGLLVLYSHGHTVYSHKPFQCLWLTAIRKQLKSALLCWCEWFWQELDLPVPVSRGDLLNVYAFIWKDSC